MAQVKKIKHIKQIEKIELHYTLPNLPNSLDLPSLAHSSNSPNSPNSLNISNLFQTLDIINDTNDEDIFTCCYSMCGNEININNEHIHRKDNPDEIFCSEKCELMERLSWKTIEVSCNRCGKSFKISKDIYISARNNNVWRCRNCRLY